MTFGLGYPDSNQERQDQNLQCYHYTIAQCNERGGNRLLTSPASDPDTHGEKNVRQVLEVGLPGLEPGKAGPESAVLPLHHSPMTLSFRLRPQSYNDFLKLQIFLRKKWNYLRFRHSITTFVSEKWTPQAIDDVKRAVSRKEWKLERFL